MVPAFPAQPRRKRYVQRFTSMSGNSGVSMSALMAQTCSMENEMTVPSFFDAHNYFSLYLEASLIFNLNLPLLTIAMLS